MNSSTRYLPRMSEPTRDCIPLCRCSAKGLPYLLLRFNGIREISCMRVHLVDGTFELYRAHFSPRPGANARVGGREIDIKATRGVLDSLVALMRDPDEAATHLAIAFDNPIASFRNDLFDGYKSDEGVPSEIRAQFDLVEDACRALGVVVWSMKEFEADDALATGARLYKDAAQVRICTPDKDLGQMLATDRVVQLDRIRKRVIDEARLKEARGIVPASIPDYLALVGDTADGIPGLSGFGEKTVSTLLAEYIHLEPLMKDVAVWSKRVRGGARLAEALAAGHEEVFLYRTLATLRQDVPLVESLDDLRYRGVADAVFLASIGAEKTVARATAS
jgi:5'-3' exonuclease